jgi:hypothetical protein
MKSNHVMVAAAAALLASGAAAAANISHAGFEKWERIHEINLCTEYAQQYKDADAYRHDNNMTSSAATLASQGESLCHTGKYRKGDADLSRALARMHLSATGTDLDNVD